MLPHAPFRQWVLTFPFALRFWLAANNKLLSKINNIATSEIGKGFGYEGETSLIKGTKCAAIHGFNLQAATFVGALQRQRLEELVAYMTRPPLATDRLSEGDNGDLVYTMKRVFSDGTSAIMLSPQLVTSAASSD